MQKKLLQITVFDDGILHFGQHVYIVVSGDYKTFTEKCNICDGTRKITVRGMEFDCPNCAAHNRSREAAKTVMTVFDFYAREYIVNEINIHGEESMCIYKKDGSTSGGRYPYARYRAFTRYGSGTDQVSTTALSGRRFEPKDPDKVMIHRLDGNDGFCFFEKKDAVAFAKRLHERQQESLAQFNAEHSTSHNYPFDF